MTQNDDIFVVANNDPQVMLLILEMGQHSMGKSLKFREFL
jgi:hypothetical protein